MAIPTENVQEDKLARLYELTQQVKQAESEIKEIKDEIMQAQGSAAGSYISGPFVVTVKHTRIVDKAKAEHRYPVSEFPEKYKNVFLGIKAVPEEDIPEVTKTSVSISIEKPEVVND